MRVGRTFRSALHLKEDYLDEQDDLEDNVAMGEFEDLDVEEETE